MKRNLLSLVLPLALSGCAVLTGCAATAPPGSLATVNSEAVTPADIKWEFVSRHGGHAKFLGGEVEARKFLDIVVDRRLLLQEAYRIGLQDEPRIKASADERLDHKLIDHFVKTEVENKAKPTEAELKAAFEARTGEVLQVRQIVVETHEEAEDLRKQVLATGDFERFARECSLAPSKMYGGRLSSLAWGTMDAAWDEKVFALEEGAVAPVLRGREGYEVVQLEERTLVPFPEYDKAKSKLEGVLKKRKTAELQKGLTEFLWKKYHGKLVLLDTSVGAVADAYRAAPDGLAATWDGGSLTVKDVTAAIDPRMLVQMPKEHAAERIRRVIEESANGRLVLLEAKARGMEKAPEVAEDVKRHRESLMEEELYATVMLKDVRVTDEDVKSYFDVHQKELTAPEKRRVAHLIAGTKEEAEGLKKRLDAGEEFVDLVKAHSKDKESVGKKGDLGWIQKEAVPKEFEAVLSLKEGDVSEPIPSKFGWHLVKVTSIEPERPLAFAEAKDDLQKKLLQIRQREKRAAWLKKLRAAATIRFNEEGIKAFAKEASL